MGLEDAAPLSSPENGREPEGTRQARTPAQPGNTHRAVCTSIPVRPAWICTPAHSPPPSLTWTLLTPSSQTATSGSRP